jgi:Mg-chelatase subunit ChlD
VIQKSQLPTPAVTVTSTTDGSAEPSDAQNWREEVHAAVHHALINQFGVLVNALANMIRLEAGGTLGQQAGPKYFHLDPSASGYKGKAVQLEGATSDSFGTTAT